MASDLAFYKKRSQKAEEKCLILDDQRRQIESLGKLPQNVTRILKENIRTITIQDGKLNDRANLEGYLSFSKAPNAESNSERFIKLFQNLKDSIARVLVMDDAREHPIESLLRKSADLDGLLSSVFGIDTHCKLEGVPNVFPILTSFELVPALTGASICDWVFGAEFQAHVMRTAPLLEQYRSLISIWCGQESLFHLDLAVHRSIIESESFKEVIIPEMSKMFRDRLTSALHPLFRKRLRRKAIRKLHSSLSDVFRLAVEVRAESLLSANHFELIWPAAESAANEADMEAMTSHPIANGEIVKLPVFPGLRAFRKERAMVEYCGFAKGAGSETTRDFVVKALVLR
ncbi:hypothetical protein BKA58DRAFT_414015 [Alternaria rosae]|uniref:uncharacterized protein n=1 Tax=Alternaria rosae TaxID=1187941 RepID=UPI001E8E7A1C|nr:uncharacterized protein BKA58DRAFT_414015 [Alternaria rosae]KAH6865284.1 hypothetical protein BKA58DRAFT_414015 [Alternaria rosae]